MLVAFSSPLLIPKSYRHYLLQPPVGPETLPTLLSVDPPDGVPRTSAESDSGFWSLSAQASEALTRTLTGDVDRGQGTQQNWRSVKIDSNVRAVTSLAASWPHINRWLHIDRCLTESLCRELADPNSANESRSSTARTRVTLWYLSMTSKLKQVWFTVLPLLGCCCAPTAASAADQDEVRRSLSAVVGQDSP